MPSFLHSRIPTTAGFTLIELAVVLLISAAIAAASFTLGTAWIAAEEYTAARRQMTAIENAFETYRRLNHRLPCPADMTPSPGLAGYEGGTGPGACTGGADVATLLGGTANTYFGAIPARALGLPTSLMFDPWGYQYVYFVDQRATDEGAFDIVNRDTTSPSTYIDPNCDNGDGRLYAAGGCTGAIIGQLRIDGSGGSTRTTRAMFAVLSHGANGDGGFDRNGVAASVSGTAGTDEGENNDNDQILVQRLRDFTAGTSHFDDLVLYKNRWHMREDVRPGETIGE